MKKSILAIILLVTCVFLSAQETIQLCATSNNLRLLYEALEPAYRDAGFTPEWLELPGSRLLAEVQSGKLDAMVAASGTMVRQFSAEYTGLGFGAGALAYSRLYMYVRVEDLDTYKPDPSTWAGLSIGEIADVGPSATFGFPKNVPDVKIITAPTYESVIRMLDSGRFDFIVSTRGGIEQYLILLKLKDRITRIDEPLLTVDYWHLVSKRYADRLPALKKAIEDRRAEIEAAIEELLNR